MIAAVLGITVFYHMLSWSSPFGNYDTLRLRKTKAHASEVRRYVVESRKSPRLDRMRCVAFVAALCSSMQ